MLLGAFLEGAVLGWVPVRTGALMAAPSPRHRPFLEIQRVTPAFWSSAMTRATSAWVMSFCSFFLYMRVQYGGRWCAPVALMRGSEWLLQ